jgi:chromosome segregation ATPase
MADPKKSKKELADELLLQRQKVAELDKEFALLQKMSKEWETLAKKKEKGKVYDEERLKALEEEYGDIDKLDKKLGSVGDKYNKLSEKVNTFNKGIKESIEDFDDLDSALVSFSNGIGKLPGLYTKLEQKTNKTKKALEGISSIIQNSTDLTNTQIEVAVSASKAYSGMTSAIANAQKSLQKGNITVSEYNNLVKQSYENFEVLADKIDDSTESGKLLKETFAAAKTETEDFTKAAEKSQKTAFIYETVEIFITLVGKC